jgi:Skp family chaperone for outer membrane proteins
MRRIVLSLCLSLVAMATVAAVELSVAVVDLERIFNESKLASDRTAKLQDEFRGKEQELAAIQKQIQGLKKDQQLYLPQNAEYQQLALEIQVLEHRAKLMVQQFERQAALAQTHATADAYQAINVLVGQFAELQGYDMVFIKPRPNVRGSDPARLQIQMHSQTLFWAKPQYDITDKFLAWADAQEAAADAKPAPSAPQIDLSDEIKESGVAE